MSCAGLTLSIIKHDDMPRHLWLLNNTHLLSGLKKNPYGNHSQARDCGLGVWNGQVMRECVDDEKTLDRSTASNISHTSLGCCKFANKVNLQL